MTTTSPLDSSPSLHQLPAKKNTLSTQDFIKMMVTQLQNQDPMDPAKSSDLLAQMSQIGQLQSSSDLQDALKGLVLQNQIGSASSLIGKNVEGLDDNNNTIRGIVNSVKVQSDGVSLELDNGQSLALGRVTSIAPASAATAPRAQAA